MATNHRHPLCTVPTLIAFSSLVAAGALAQETPQRQTQEAPMLEEIVVTGVARDLLGRSSGSASRLRLDIVETPQSVSVLTQDMLELANIRDLGQAMTLVSGVTYGERNFSQPQYNFRGFEGGVLGSVRVDNFRTNNFFLPDRVLIEQIDVVKGPVAINFGETPPGGTINLVTKRPLDESATRLQAEIGSWERQRITADTSGVVEDLPELRYRVVGAYEKADNFVDFVNEELLVFGSSLDWQASDRLSVAAKAFYQTRDELLDVGGTVTGDLNIPDVTRSRFYGQPWGEVDATFLNAGVEARYALTENLQLAALADYQRIERYSLFAQLGGPIDDAGNANLTRREDAEGISRNRNYEFNLSGSFQAFGRYHDFYAGLQILDGFEDDVNHARVALGSFNIFNPIYVDKALPPPGAPLSNYGQQTFDSTALSLQGYFRLTDRLSLMLGGRYSDDERETEVFICDPSPCTFEITPDQLSRGAPFQVAPQEATEFVPNVGLVYAVNDNVNIYANYSESFELQGGTTVGGDLIDPREGEQFEIGAKMALYDGSLVITTALYQIDLSNVAQADEDNPGFVIGAGARESEGFEIDVVGRLASGWNVIAQYGHVDASIVEHPSLAGLKPPRVPEHSGSLFTTYELQTGRLQGLGFGAGIRYVGEREANVINRFTQEAYDVVDVQLFYNGWRNVELLASLSNILDEEYYNVTFDGSPNGVRPGEPRNFRLSVAVTF